MLRKLEKNTNTNTPTDILEIFFWTSNVVAVGNKYRYRYRYQKIFLRYSHQVQMFWHKLGTNIFTTWNKNSLSLSVSCPTNFDLIYPMDGCWFLMFCLSEIIDWMLLSVFVSHLISKISSVFDILFFKRFPYINLQDPEKTAWWKAPNC